MRNRLKALAAAAAKDLMASVRARSLRARARRWRREASTAVDTGPLDMTFNFEDDRRRASPKVAGRWQTASAVAARAPPRQRARTDNSVAKKPASCSRDVEGAPTSLQAATPPHEHAHRPSAPRLIPDTRSPAASPASPADRASPLVHTSPLAEGTQSLKHVQP